jgi:anti-anti-sigma regulatory factor
MLKISLVDGPHQRRMIVEGTLVAPWAAELTVAYERARADLQSRELIVDLRGLTAVGPAGEDVLLQLLRDKTTFQCGVFARELLRQLVRHTQGNEQDAEEEPNDPDSDL